MSANFGAIETVLSLFLAGMFGVTGYMTGYGIALRGRQLILLALVLLSAALWAWIVFVTDYPHLLAANKAALIANATLWPFCLGSVSGYFIHHRDHTEQNADDWSA